VTQVATFLVTSGLMLAFAVGVSQATAAGGSLWGPRLIAVLGVGLLGAAAFVTGPLGGYPPALLIR
jgi:Protein of unknown function (DUF998)